MCNGGECVGTPNDDNVCDDADVCTSDDQCVDGECVGEEIIDCEDDGGDVGGALPAEGSGCSLIVR